MSQLDSLSEKMLNLTVKLRQTVEKLGMELNVDVTGVRKYLDEYVEVIKARHQQAQEERLILQSACEESGGQF